LYHINNVKNLRSYVHFLSTKSHHITFHGLTLVQLIRIPLAFVIGFTSSFKHKVRETHKRRLISTEGSREHQQNW